MNLNSNYEIILMSSFPEPPRSKKKKNLNNLLNSILKEIPEEKKLLSNQIKSIKTTLHYTAPEILDNIVLKIYDFLQINIPLYDEKEKTNPQWVLNINLLWNMFLNHYGQQGENKSTLP